MYFCTACSDTPMHTPIGESSSTDEVLFTKRRSTRTVIRNVSERHLVECRQTQTNERECGKGHEAGNQCDLACCAHVPKNNCQKKSEETETKDLYPPVVQKNVCPLATAQRDLCSIPPVVQKNICLLQTAQRDPCTTQCPPTVPDFPEDTSSCSSEVSSELLFHEISPHLVALESSQAALVPNDRQNIQFKATRKDETIKITFNDAADSICVQVPPSRPSPLCNKNAHEEKCHINSNYSHNSEDCDREEECVTKLTDSCNKGKQDFHCKLRDEPYTDYHEMNNAVITGGGVRQRNNFTENLHYRIERAIHPDTNVLIDGKEFPCHMLALQVYSKKIDDEIRPKKFQLELPAGKVSAKIFPYLMDWILASDNTKVCTICSENVIGLYCASKFLKICELRRHCHDFVKRKVSEEDPLMLKLWGETRGRSDCEELQKLFASKLTRMFMKIYKSDQFLHFNVDEMIMVLEDCHLTITSEMDVYDAVVRWLLFDWSKRKHETNNLMTVVRFGLMPPVELMKLKYCMNDPHYPEIFTCEVEKMIQNGVQYSILSETYNRRPTELTKWLQISKISQPRPRICLLDYYVHSDDLRMPRTNMGQESPIAEDHVKCLPQEPRREVSDHDYENINIDIIEEIRRSAQEHDSKMLLAAAQRKHSAATLIQRKVRQFLRRKVIIFGGCDPRMDFEDRKNWSHKVHCYENDNWLKIDKMPESRTHFTAIHLKGIVYIIGGCDPRLENDEGRPVATKTVWAWQIKTHQWSRCASMNVARSHYGCVSFRGLIYVFGGQDEKSRALKKCEMFDPERNKWTERAPLVNPTFSMAVAKYDEFIWLIGGLTKMKTKPLLDTVSIYSPQDNQLTQWEITFPFSIGFTSALVFNKEIYVLGGVNKYKKSLDTVFKFEFEHSKWVQVGSLSFPRHAHSVISMGTSALIIGGVSSIHQDVIASVESFSMKDFRSQLLCRLPSKMTGVSGVCV